MNRFPDASAKDISKILLKNGFYEHHQKGSHKVFNRDNDKKRVIVPYHGNKSIPRKTLKAILMDAGLTLDQYKELV